MKLFFLFVIAVVLLLTTNLFSLPSGSEKKNIEPKCCNKQKCIKEKQVNDKEDPFNFQLNPFHI
jgi:short subunit fatty acids transporter